MRMLLGCLFFLLTMSVQTFAMDDKNGGEGYIDGIEIIVGEGFSPTGSEEENSPRGSQGSEEKDVSEHLESEHSQSDTCSDSSYETGAELRGSDFESEEYVHEKNASPRSVANKVVPGLVQFLSASSQVAGRLERSKSMTDFSTLSRRSDVGFENDTVIDIDELRKKIQKKGESGFIRGLLKNVGMKKVDDGLVRTLSLLKYASKIESTESFQEKAEGVSELQKVLELCEELKKEKDEKVSGHRKKARVKKACTIGTVLSAGVFILLNTAGSWGPFVTEIIEGTVGGGSTGNSTAIVASNMTFI